MELKIVYKDNSVRLIRPTPEFYNDSKPAIRDKVDRICFDTGVIYQADLYQGINHLVDLDLDYNKPPEAEIRDRAFDEKERRARRKAVRKHKKKLENPVFTFLIKGGKTVKLVDINSKHKKSKEIVVTPAA